MDIKTASNVNARNLDSDKSWFEKIETELKNIIFGALFILLKEEESSLIIALLYSFWMFLQILYFNFHEKVHFI